MRTTVTLDDDVVALIQRVRDEKQIGVSRAVNQLIRAGAAASSGRATYEHRSAPLELAVDVTHVGVVVHRLEADS